MPAANQAHLRSYLRKKYTDPEGFKQSTLESSLRSQIRRWRQGMEQLEQEKEDIELELMEAKQVKLKHYIFCVIYKSILIKYFF